MSRIVWRELMSPNADLAADFYAKLFDWSVDGEWTKGAQPWERRLSVQIPGGAEYPVASVTRLPDGMSDWPSLWMAYVHVGEVAEDLDRLRDDGVHGRVSSSDGRCHHQVLGSFPLTAPLAHRQVRSEKREGKGGHAAAVGCFCWDQLTTRRDLATVGDRFKRLFGWELVVGGDGFGSFELDGVRVAGVQQALPGSDVPDHWLPFVRVANIEEAVGRALEKDGAVVVPPSEHPQRSEERDEVYAVVGDPTGGVVGLRAWVH